MSQHLFEKWAQSAPSIRTNILKMIHQAGNGHPGGSLSLVEILLTLLGEEGLMNHDPKNPTTQERDRLVLSKGHGVPALYAVYSHVGYDISEQELMTLRQLDSRLQGHPDRNRISYLEACTGSLGQGASIAQGLAMAYKMDQKPYRLWGILGDGEMQEGQIWEVALSAPHHRLNNLTLILDYNKGQIDGPTDEVLSLGALKDKWQAFGWHTHEVNGHSYSELYQALSDTHETKPCMVIAHTIKGKGVSFMEDVIKWHGVAPNDEELETALKEVNESPLIGL